MADNPTATGARLGQITAVTITVMERGAGLGDSRLRTGDWGLLMYILHVRY